jgi:hypothetical protein
VNYDVGSEQLSFFGDRLADATRQPTLLNVGVAAALAAGLMILVALAGKRLARTDRPPARGRRKGADLHPNAERLFQI